MRKLKQSNIQLSESLLNAVFLILSGGFQDSYTYFCRGKVFANAQTGNILLMGSHAANGEWMEAYTYIIPILSFILGIFVAELIHRKYKYTQRLHWRQIIVAAEILILFSVSFISNDYDMTANALVSFVCAMQVQTFRKIEGNVFATTMCIGNLRTASESICTYMFTRDKKLLLKARKYLFIVGIFAIGAGLGSVFTKMYNVSAIRFSCIFLTMSFLLMFIKEEDEVRNEAVENLA